MFFLISLVFLFLIYANIFYSILQKYLIFKQTILFFQSDRFPLQIYKHGELSFLKNLSNLDLLRLFDYNFFQTIILNAPTNLFNNHPLLYISLVSSPYLNNMDLCISSALNIGLKRKEILLFCLDFFAYKYFSKKNIQTFFFNYSTIIQGSWSSIGRLKQVIQYYFNCLGADVFFFESDMLFNDKNFISETFQNLKNNVDISIIPETRHLYKEINLSLSGSFSYNIGLMFVKSSFDTRHFFRNWLFKCYNESLWDQAVFIQMVKNATIFKTNNDKQFIHFHFSFGDGNDFNLKFQLLSSVKYVNYCNLAHSCNSFGINKINQLLAFAKGMNLKNPYFLHFACITGKFKFFYTKNISLNYNSYEYHMNYLKHYFHIK